MAPNYNRKFFIFLTKNGSTAISGGQKPPYLGNYECTYNYNNKSSIRFIY